MAKMTADLGDINTGFLKPVAPVQPSGADVKALTDLGELAITGLKVGTTASLVSDLQQAEDEFIASAEEELTFEEKEELNTFSRRVSSLQRKAKATQRTSDFKIRAEAMLKERINQFPGLASHYRKAASGFLGFNPEGAEAAAMESALKAQTQDAQSQLKFIDNDAVKRFNLAPGAVLTDPSAQMEYQAGLAAEAEKDDWNRLAAIEESKTKLGLGTYNSEQFQTRVLRASDNLFLDVNNLVKAKLASFGVDRSSTNNGITSEHLQALTPEQLLQVKGDIELQKINTVEEYLRGMASAPAQVRDSVKAQLEAPFNRAVSLLNSKATLEEFDNRSKINTHKLINSLTGPEVETAQVFSALGQKLPDGPAVELYNYLLRDNKIIKRTEASADEKAATVTNPDNTEGLRYTIDSIKKQMEARFSTEAPAELDVELLDSTALNLYEAYAEHGNAIPRKNFSTFFEAHAQEGAEGYINKLKQVSPLFTPEIKASAVSFTERTLKDAQNKTAEILNKYTQSKVVTKDKRGRATLKEEIIPFELNVGEGGFLTIAINPELEQIAPELLQTTVLGSRQVAGKLTRELNKLKTSYIKDLNNVVATMAAVEGVSKKDAATRLFSDTGWLPAEEIEGEGGE